MLPSPRLRASRISRSTRLGAGLSGPMVLVCGLLTSLWGAAAVASPLFAPHVDFPTGADPRSVAIGDLNRDGVLDLVVANAASSTVSVLLGNGAGGFGAKTDFATGAGAISLAIRDLNGDGKLDLAVANVNDGTASVLLGNGAGGFGPKTDFPTGAGANAIAIGDLNGDGSPDLVVGNADANTVSVLLGNGTGGFGAKTDFAPAARAVSTAVGDLNADGRLDLAVANQSASSVWVLLGDGAGGFGPKTDYATAATPYSVAIGDVSGDGKPDLVTAGTGVSVLLGAGGGTFNPKTDFPIGGGPAIQVAIGDLDVDGRPDLVTANYGSSTVSVLLGNGAGGFGPRTAYATGSNPYSVALGDLNGTDGPDLVVANTHSNTVSVLLSKLAPSIASIKDVPNDQGGKVHVLWDASFLDTAPSYGISSYNLWRRITTTSALQAVERGAALLESGVDFEGGMKSRAIRVTTQGTQSVYWEFVASVPARGQSGYGYMASTTSDSMASGIPWNVFFVDAKDAASSAFYVSSPDSGYSVDNLPPLPPALFLAAYESGATHLHWGPNGEPDLWYYKVYRGSTAGFVPGSSNLIATRADTGYVDVGPAGSYYKLSAVDVNGNESGYAVLTPGGTVDVTDGATLVFALEGAWPNPTTSGRMAVSFVLAVGAPARLELVDVRGRVIAVRDVGSLGVGRHVVDLAAGQKLRAGIYLVRLTQGGLQRTARAVVLE